MDFKKFLTMISEAESTAEKDNKAEKAGKKVAKDIEYDEGHKGKDDDKAEKAGKKVTKDIEYDDKKDKKEKKSLKDWFEQIDKNILEESIDEAKSDYKVKNIGHDIKGDYYISPSTGKKVYQSGVKRGDHENPKTGKVSNAFGASPADRLSVREQGVAEAEQLTIEPAKQSTQVIKRGNEVVGSVSNPALAATIKSAIGKGEMSLAGHDMKEEAEDNPESAMLEKWAGDAKVKPTGQYKDKTVEELKSMLAKLKKSGPHDENSPAAKKMRQINFALRAKGGWKKGEGAAMKEEQVDEKAVSKAQQKFMGMVHAAQKGEKPASKAVADVAKSMKKGDVKDFAQTKHKGLPEKKKKTTEADIPKSGPDYGAGLGAGRSQTTFEGKKPDFLDLDKDGNKKESMKKAAADKKTKKVNEAMNTLEAAYHEGKSHGLTKHGYACRYDEGTDEHRRYHEGFKEGLDECYGLMPNRGLVVSEVESGQDVVDNMASYGAEEGSLAESNLLATSNDSFTDIDLDIVDPNTKKKVARVLGDSFNGQIYIGDDVYTWEAGGERITNKEGKTIARNMSWDAFLTKKLGKQIEDEYGELLGEMDKTAYMQHKAKTTPGDSFKAFGQTFKDKEVLETDAFAFESLDKQLNALLTENEDISEGLSVNMSQGLGGPNGDMEDTVSVTAQGDDAGKLLQFIKQVGLGGLGNDQQLDGPSEPVVAVSDYGAPKFTGHDNGGPSMADLLQKMAGEDYKDEEGHDHAHEEKMCEVHGMEEAKCGCGEGKEMVDEVESEDQMEYQVAEDDGEGYEQGQEAAAQIDSALAVGSENEKEVHEGGDGMEGSPEAAGAVAAADADEEQEEAMSESNSFLNLYKKLAWLAEESTAEKDDKAEKAAKKVAKDIEYDEGHKGKDDEKAEKAGEKVKKDIEYDDKKDKKKKVDEWANDAGKDGTQQTFERDIEFMTKVISGGLNKPKSTGQQTIPVLAGDKERTGDEDMAEFKKLAGLGQ